MRETQKDRNARYARLSAERSDAWAYYALMRETIDTYQETADLSNPHVGRMLDVWEEIAFAAYERARAIDKEHRLLGLEIKRLALRRINPR